MSLFKYKLVNKIEKWMNRKENRTDIYLTTALYFIFVITNVFVNLWIKYFYWREDMSELYILFLFPFTIFVMVFIFITIFFSVRLTRRANDLERQKNLKYELTDIPLNKIR
jgi:uncharacterized membrane protein